jgi:hypothetical protein
MSQLSYDILSQNTGGACSGDGMIMNGGHNLVEGDESGRARVSLLSILVRAVIFIVLSQWERNCPPGKMIVRGSCPSISSA